MVWPNRDDVLSFQDMRWHRSTAQYGKTQAKNLLSTGKPPLLFSSSIPELLEEIDDDDDTFMERLLRMFSQTFNAEKVRPGYVKNPKDRRRVQFVTLVRVGLPSVLTGVVATLTFPAMALFLAGLWNTNPGTLAVLSQDSSQFVQNFLTVAGLLFSILVGQTCTCSFVQKNIL